jgi:hypothetical protein
VLCPNFHYYCIQPSKAIGKDVENDSSGKRDVFAYGYSKELFGCIFYLIPNLSHLAYADLTLACKVYVLCGIVDEAILKHFQRGDASTIRAYLKSRLELNTSAMKDI